MKPLRPLLVRYHAVLCAHHAKVLVRHNDVLHDSHAQSFPLLLVPYFTASGVGLELHQPTVERMKENYSKRGVELNEARLRMAKLPQTAEVLSSYTYQLLSAWHLFC